MSARSILRRYAVPLAALAALGALSLAVPPLAGKVGTSLLGQVKTMLLVVPPIFLLLGLLDVWVPRETLMRFLGPGSGIRGPLISFVLGSAAAGPLYGAFPVASTLMRKGASFANVLIFVGAWSTTKVPMLLFEAQALGARFALARLAIDLVGIALIAAAIPALLPKGEIERVYRLAAEAPGKPSATR